MKKVINLAETTNVVRFRQTFNQWSKNWEIPKRENDDGKWLPIDRERLTPVITKAEGYRFALWRMRKIMQGRRDECQRPMWKVNKISTTHKTVKGIKYSVFQFDCHRIAHGIVGGMNTTGGA
jgi:hypothetical protein